MAGANSCIISRGIGIINHVMMILLLIRTTIHNSYS
jgi:hypothetical protein